jgi:hypothetical protein
MSPWRVSAKCDRCGAVHNPWGVHAGEEETRYEIWVTETGAVESTLTVDRDADVSESEARMRFTSQLERFLAGEYLPPRLWESTVMLRLGFDADSESGPAYGPVNAPEHLCRTLGEFVDLALDDLSRRP